METNRAVVQNKWLEKTSTSLSMVILALGFGTLGLVSFTTKFPEGVANSLPFENALSMIGSAVSILIGATFLVAAYFYWTR